MGTIAGGDRLRRDHGHRAIVRAVYVGRTIPIISIWRYDRLNMLFFAAYSGLVCAAHIELGVEVLGIPFLAVGTLGTAVAIMLGFKNNSAYGRWSDARQAWGGIVSVSRNFGSMVGAYIADPEARQGLVRRQIAVVHALVGHLRRQDVDGGLHRLLQPEDRERVAGARNVPVQLIHRQAQHLRQAMGDGNEGSFFLMAAIKDMYTLAGRAEGIKNTPLLRHYSYFTSLFVKVFVYLLPFGFVADLGWLTIPIHVVVATMFYMLDGVGALTEDPFENNFNDVPMSTLCRTIEIDLREQMGEADLPPALEPMGEVLM